MTIIDDVISRPDMVQKSVSGHFLKQYYLKVSSCQKEIYSENLNYISFFWLLIAVLVLNCKNIFCELI